MTETQKTEGEEPTPAPAPVKVPVGGLFVANTTFATNVDGVPVIVHKGRDRVREGHQLLADNPQYFDAVELGVTFDVAPGGGVEQATSEPGEKRGEPAAQGGRRKRGS